MTSPGARPLNAREERFCDEYLVDLNATQAAIRAGYSPKAAKQQGYRLLTKADLAERIRIRREQLREETRLSQRWVLLRLKENVERAMQAVPVLDAAGKPTGTYYYEGGVANRGLELIGRHLGMWKGEGQEDPGGDQAIKGLTLHLGGLPWLREPPIPGLGGEVVAPGESRGKGGEAG